MLGIAVTLTASFMIIEAIVGWWSGSLALLADAGHMLADTGSLGLALVAQRVARRPRTATTTYGYHRAEVIAAFLNGIVLAVVAILVLAEAVERWLAPQPIRGGAMLGAAVAGLAINLFVAWLLWRSERSERSSVNVRAALAHVVTDALGSVGAIVAAICVLGWQLHRADPVLSALIAVLVAYSGWRVLRETVAILLEGAPPQVDMAGVGRTIRESPGVADLHDLHVWRLSDGFDALTVHVIVSAGHHGITVCREVALRLREDHGLVHVTIQPEAPGPQELVPLRLRGAREPGR